MQVAATEFITSRWQPTIPTAADYVQDGLIALWDGVENIGWNSHSDTATTWIDLVNGANLTIREGGTWGDNHLQTSGAACGAYAASNTTKMQALLNAVKHYQCCFSIDVAYTTSKNFVEFRYAQTSSTLSKILVGIAGLTGARYHFAINKTFGVTQDISRHSAACTFTDRNTVSALWFDGVSKTPSSNASQGVFGSAFTIGSSANTTSNLCKGKMFCLRFYNRNLTAEEVCTNTTIDRKRFHSL